ncbi:trehalose-phosphatase [Jatrophihabitans telluris]|uniref:Trehalose 6-phosphate phosphatase n=1 Tax=Jatrophihabitans telluris TaxID=2038343 RepID=A0ABY4R1P0_9ACTN|nr:trehalose-phosphatase [Jatrophihabitans telluris]UQX89831.1 trehalose-phosphatase [Jatrophihabitans telluris]
MTGTDDFPPPDLAHTVIGLDFDGTLSEIVPNPDAARAADGTAQALAVLAAAGARIAIVTGRDAETVLRLSGLSAVPGLVVSGLHGAQWWRDGQLRSRDEPPGIAQLRAQLPPVLERADPGVWLEDKGLSLVVHTRRAADPVTELDRLRPEVRTLAEAAGLQVVDGKGVLEIRIPQLSKADAVAELLTPDVRTAVFGGDDIGDLPAFEQLRRWARQTGGHAYAVAVGDVAEVRAAADRCFDDPADLVRWLRQLGQR